MKIILPKLPGLQWFFRLLNNSQKDAYALDYLAQLLSNGKKTPFYKVLVKDKKLTSSVNAYNQSLELAGTFEISVTANPGVSLTEVEKAIFEGFEMFETEGFTEEEILLL